MTDNKYKHQLGLRYANILMLKRDPEDDTRFLTSWGNKTPIGIYEVIHRFVRDGADLTE